MALREILASFGFQVDDSKLKQARASVDSAADSIKGMVAVVGGAAILNGVRNFVTEMTALGDSINDTAARLGMGTTELQQWQLAAKLCGVSADEFSAGVKTLQKNIVDAAAGTGAAKDTFRQLGIEVKNTDGSVRSASEVMRDMARAISDLPEGAKRTEAMLTLMGRAGFKLGPMFANGTSGLEELLGELDKLGGGIGEEAIQTLADFDDNMVRWDTATMSVKATLVQALFPSLQQLTVWLTRGVVWFKRLSETSNVAKATVLVLGTAAAVAGAKAMLPWLPFIAGMALAILLVDDLITLFDGGDSVIGSWIDSMFGAGKSAEWVKKAKAWASELWTELDKADGATAKVKVAFDKIAPVVEEALSVAGEAMVRQLISWGDQATAPSNRTAGVILDGIMGGLVPLPIQMTMKAHEAFEGLKSAAAAKGRELLDRMRQIGRDVSQGLADGIADLASAPIDAIANLGDAVIKRLKSVFRSNSPAESTADEGDNLNLGLAKGLARSAQTAERMAGDVSQRVLLAYSPELRLPEARGSRSAPAASQPIQFDSRPTYQIVLPASAAGQSVREQARAGAMQAQDQDRRATLMALEALAPEPA